MGWLSKTFKKITGAIGKIAPIAAPFLPGPWSGAAAALGGFASADQRNVASAEAAQQAFVNSLEGQQRSFDFQNQQAQRQMDYQTSSSAKQMDFQERMANTAHQREIQDLRAAGLNPILSAGGGGAAVPVGASGSGASGSGASASGFQADVSDVMASVSSAKIAQANIANIEADTRLKEAQAESEKQRPENISMDTKGKLSQAMLAEALQTKAKNEGLLVASQEVAQTIRNKIDEVLLPETKKAELRKLLEEVEVTKAEADRAKTDQKFFDSKMGEIMRSVRLVLYSIGIGSR